MTREIANSIIITKVNSISNQAWKKRKQIIKQGKQPRISA